MKAEQDATKAALKAAWPQGGIYDVGAVPASPGPRISMSPWRSVHP